jgi:enoyl-CoA hydratase
MTDYTNIICDVTDGVATLTLNRPQKLNAMSNHLVEEFIAALDIIAADAAVEVVVLTGAGRGFCAGFDVAEGDAVPDRSNEWWRQHFRLGYEGMNRLWTMPQPCVAKVRGPCLGGGFGLSLLCDLIYASDDAYFGEPEVKFGGGSNSAILPLLLSPRHINELLLTGRTFDARRAADLGLINEVLPADDLDARVDQVVRHMRLLPPSTLTRNKARLHDCFAIMGFAEIWGAEDVRTLDKAFKRDNNTPFTQQVRAVGMTGALRWQKERFDTVGAFPR